MWYSSCYEVQAIWYEGLEMQYRTLIPITQQTPGVAYPGKADELWLVPQQFQVQIVDGSLPYEIGFIVGQHEGSTALAIIEMHIRRIEQPIHSTGLRELHLPELLEQAIRMAAKYHTLDPDFGWVIDETSRKQPIPIDGIRRITKNTKRNNSPKENEAVRALRLVEQLQRNGVPDWVKRACDELGVSRMTLYRRLSSAGYEGKLPQKKGKK